MEKYSDEENLKKSNFEINNDNERLLDVDNSFNNSLKLEKIKRIKKVLEKSKLIYISIVLGMIFSLITSILGVIIFNNSGQFSSLIFILLGIISSLIFVWSIYAYHNFYSKNSYLLSDNSNSHNNFIEDFKIEEFENSKEKTYFDYSMFSLMVLCIIILLISVRNIFYQDGIIYEIKSLSENKIEWNKKINYPIVESEDLIKKVQILLSIFGYLGIIISIIISTILFSFYKLLGYLETLKLLIQFTCIIFLKFGLLLFYLSIYTGRYKGITKMDKSMPFWIPDSILGISIITIAISIFGFFSITSNNKDISKLLKVFTIIIALFTFTIVILQFGSILFTEKIKENNCVNVINYIHNNYLINTIGCNRKYESNFTNFNNPICPKEKIVTNWENNLNKSVYDQIDSYSCVDMECCHKFYASVKDKIDHITISIIFLFAFSCILTAASWKVNIMMDNNFDKNFIHTQSKAVWIFYIKIIKVIILTLILIFFIPKAPIPNPAYIAENNYANIMNSRLDSNWIIPADFEGLKMFYENEKMINNFITTFTIIEDKTNCNGECLTLQFYFELTFNDGIILLKNQYKDKIGLYKNLTTGNNFLLSFIGESKDLNDFYNYFIFIPNCPLLEDNKIKVRIFSNTNLLGDNNDIYKNIENFINNSTDNKSIQLIYNKIENNQTYLIVDTELYFSFVEIDKFKNIKGVVKKLNSIPEGDTKNSSNTYNLTINSVSFPKCQDLITNTNSNGEFLFEKIKLLKSKQPVEYKIKIANDNDNENYSQIFNFGQLGNSDSINLGKIFLNFNNKTEKQKINSKIIKSTTNEPEFNVTIYLYNSEVNLQNKILSNENEQELVINKIPDNFIAKTNSNIKGEFSFVDLPKELYTLLLYKEGFYREIISNIYIINYFIIIGFESISTLEFIQITPLLNLGEIRFVLSHSSINSEINFYSNFKLDNNSICEVYLGKKNCVDTYITINNNTQIIDIKRLGKYIYSFGVSKIKNIGEFNSKISVYIFGYILPILELNLNEENDNQWLIAFCLNGNEGISSINQVNKLFIKKPSFTYCEELYNKQ